MSPTRTMAACIESVQSLPFARMRFDAWRILSARGEVQPLQITAASLEDALAVAATHCGHGDTLLIREADGATGRALLHFYAIKRESKGRWVADKVTGVPAKVHRLYPERLFGLAVRAFEPVEPWRWSESDRLGNRHTDGPMIRSAPVEQVK